MSEKQYPQYYISVLEKQIKKVSKILGGKNKELKK
jgi:hypothetical protein